MIISKLAYRQLTKNKKRTLFTISGILLSVAMMTAILMFYESADRFLRLAGSGGENPTAISQSGKTLLFSSCGVLELIIIFSSVLVISNAFQISAGERIKEFGVLKSMGATREQIRRSILTEAFLLSAITVPAGLVVGFVLETGVVGLVNHFLREILQIASGGKERLLYPVFSLPSLCGTVVLSVITIVISAWLPAARVCGMNAVDAIKLTEEIRLTAADIRTPKWLCQVMGAEGLLAVRSVRRDKRKYRISTLSLVVGMIMFIGGYSFCENLNYITQIRFPDRKDTINVRISIAGVSQDDIKSAGNNLRALSGGKTWLSYTAVCPYMGNAVADQMDNIQVHAVSRERFIQLCDELSVRSENLFSGILVKMQDLTQSFSYKQDMAVSIGNQTENKVTILGVMEEMPFEITPLFGEETINLVVSEECFFACFPDGSNIMAVLSAAAEDSEAYCTQVGLILEGMETGNITVKISDLLQEWKQERGTSYLINCFMMGFAGILSLTAVISVTGTILSSLIYRRKEFAVLRSAGMPEAGLRRLLNYECLLYGGKALILGIPAGILVSRISYVSFACAYSFPYIFPWKGILISAVTVILLISIITWYAFDHIKGDSIAQLLE